MKPIGPESAPSRASDDSKADVVRSGECLVGRFRAMASPCEVMIDTVDNEFGHHLIDVAVAEVRRIELKFSRYRADSVVSKMNTSHGRTLALDPETRRLLDFAARCHALSNGAFDITSGVLREVWTFDGTGTVPSAADVTARLERIGFDQLERNGATVAVPPGMEIDFGGIAKEYAVDRALACASAIGPETALLVNLGGDLAVTGPPRAGHWRVGQDTGATDVSGMKPVCSLFELKQGALATSGNANRSIVCGGRRYGHILDPRTGWPVENSPDSVTVAGTRCIDAGVLSTLALLQGQDAESFLEQAGCQYWCHRCAAQS